MSDEYDPESNGIDAEEVVPPEAGDILRPVTSAQAKVEAIASLTHKAYERASMLQLSQEEIERLQQDFPDEAFRPGAAGKEALIYIEHAFLRDRLNQVIGVGQWALVPRSRWSEQYVTGKGQPATRIYVEAMLLVRGCFVSESVGDMVYYPNNESQNYGDAVEGAKTAALRRCCKEFGIGLQAWKKGWCEEWWKRRNGPRQARQPQASAPRPASPPAQAPATPPAAKPAPTFEQKVAAIGRLETIDATHKTMMAASKYPAAQAKQIAEAARTRACFLLMQATLTVKTHDELKQLDRIHLDPVWDWTSNQARDIDQHLGNASKLLAPPPPKAPEPTFVDSDEEPPQDAAPQEEELLY